MTAWESFSTLWPDDQLKAKGFVAEIQQVVNATDSFTRMKQALETEQREKREAKQKELAAERAKRAQRAELHREIGGLFNEPNHQKRGKALESLLNRLFASFDILVREAFTIRGDLGEGVIAQLDGALTIDGDYYLVEMKWLKEKVGPEDISPHVGRVLHRSEAARGIFISATDYTPGAIHMLREALNFQLTSPPDCTNSFSLWRRKPTSKTYFGARFKARSSTKTRLASLFDLASHVIFEDLPQNLLFCTGQIEIWC